MMSRRTPAPPRLSMAALLRIVVAVPVCAMLLWGVATTAIGTQAARLGNAPLMAAFATGRHPDVATQLAAQFLAARQTGDAIPLARAAVLNDPLNVKALTILGLALEQDGRDAQADTILRRAASMGWRNTASLVWDLAYAARHDDANRVVVIADALARRQQAGSLTRTVFFGSLAEPRMRRVLVQRLAAGPSWRPGFFADVHDRLGLTQLDGMDAVLRGLRATGAPPTTHETLLYIDRMVQLGTARRAHLYWADTFAIPPADLAAQPFDGRFARVGKMDPDAPRSMFEWQIDPDLNDSMSFVTQAGGFALRIEPGVASGAVMATQTLVLSPGEHVLRTRIAAGTGATAPAGWTISCLPADQPLLRTMAGDHRDELSQLAVTVPAQGCAAQRLRLIGLDRIDAQAATIASVAIR